MNINRDYLIINDVKKSNVKLDNGSIVFYITDKNTQNIFVNLVINVSNNDLIQKYANIENAEDYTLTMNIVKPSNTYKIVEGKLHDKEKAIFEFDLKEDCCDEVGTYKCELLTKCNINDHEEITTSNKLTYKVKSSVLNDLDEIQEAPEYPLVIQLFDKLSDIEQYEEDRRANELARQLAEQQRQARFNALDTDMTDSIQAIDNKVIDVENRVSAKEQAVDKLIVDTKADIDEYKVVKDQEINNAITAQDNKIDTAITTQNDRITVVENNVVAQNSRLDVLENKDTLHEARLDTIEAKNTEQDGRLDIAENRLANIGNDITNTMQPIIDAHTSRLEAIEAIDVSQNNRLNIIEAKNQQQDDRLLDIEKVNNRQNIDIKCLYGASQTIDVAKEGNSIYLQNSNNGFAIIDEIQGNTLVNCNKEPDKELILNGNINTSGDNTVTITEGVDGGLVDVALEGNTLVNVSKTKDSTAISMSYTVENSGNHIALQGDVDGSCRPVITGNTLVNGAIRSGDIEVSTSSLSGELYGDTLAVKSNTTYTISYFIKASNNFTVTNQSKSGMFRLDEIFNDNTSKICYGFVGDLTTEYQKVVATFTTSNVTDKTLNVINIRLRNAYTDSVFGLESNTLTVKDVIILEGDYTDKPIPDYFTGLQSSFEDNLVTQEMVDSGEEVADNLGKYRVDYKSTREDGTVGSTKTLYLNSPLLEGDTIEEKDGGIYHVHRSDRIIIDGSNASGIFTSNTNYSDKKRWVLIQNNTIANIGVNEITTINDKYHDVTPSNTYMCAEGLCQNAGSNCIYLYLNKYSDGSNESKQLLINELRSNPVNVVYKLASPQYELIEQSNLAIPSYANGHLDFNTAVPIEKVEFKPFEEELTYLYANTKYTVQFISTRAILVDCYLGGALLLSQSIVAGLNRISITTPSELVDNKLTINGNDTGANIMEVIVTDADREFRYFEGMKSVGECEDLEIVSNNKNLFDMNDLLNYLNENSEYGSYEQNGDGYNIVCNRASTDLYTNFKPNTQYTLKMKGCLLEGFSVTQFMFVYNDGTVQYSGISDTLSDKVIVSFPNKTIKSFKLTKASGFSKSYFEYIQLEEGSTATDYIPHQSNSQQLTHEPLRAVEDVKDRYVLIDGKWYIERNCKQENMSELVFAGDTSDTMKCLILFKSKSKAISNIFSNSRGYESATKGQMYVQERGNGMTYLWIPSDPMSREEFTNFLNEKNAKIVYAMATPVYEPLDYNPLEVYSDTTHITTNSIIPCNIAVKNHGFNCLLKPSTTYTISSNLGLNTVTTPSTLTEDCLRFMDTDTSNITTMRDVLVLEGDWTSKADLIPSNFSGIESAFEQEYDAEKGKYKVNIKVTNEDKSKENNVTFYINEPLRGTGTVKDRIFIQDGKVIVQRNCDSITLDGSKNIDKSSTNYDSVNNITFSTNVDNISSAWLTSNKIICSILPSVGSKVWGGALEGIASDSTKIMFCVARRKLQTQDLNGFKQWLQQNPTTIIYPLAEPVYEEVEYNDTKLFIESFKNSTLFYNSNVPVTSKLYYSYSVPIVDTVARTASISDEQDQLIIDLATQVAVLEMMTM